MDKKVKVLITFGILILLGVGFYLASYTITKTTGYTITGRAVYTKEEKIQIAKCITTQGVELYCSTLSLNCQRQKKDLGDSFEFISYVDCGEEKNLNECEGLDLPSWKINNRFFKGIRDLGSLATSTGCNIR
tara:strand:- start:1563 stop:1958 length:396 start_codon:yes stop_codon:yes gene_type:complete